MAEQLSAEAVYTLSRTIQTLRDALWGSQVLMADNVVSGSDASIFRKLVDDLAQSLRRYGLAPSELQTIETALNELKNAEKEKPSHYEHQERLRRLIERVDAAVRHEIQSARNFKEIRPTEGILDYVRLLSEGVRSLFENETYYRVPPRVKQDLDESSKSLSFGAPTACVMIGLRAVEGQLRNFYQATTGQPFSKPWGALVPEIERLLKEGNLGNTELPGYLDYLRVVRNQADHPDKSFTNHEAEQLLMHVVYTIEAVQKVIPKPSKR